MERSAVISKGLVFSEELLTLADEGMLILQNISNYSSNNTELIAQET
jgi:hypothetical protein